MKKLRLEITELQVEPFDTGTRGDGRKGTVFARRTISPDETLLGVVRGHVPLAIYL